MTNGSDDCMAKTGGFVFILNTRYEKELVQNHSTVGVLLIAKKKKSSLSNSYVYSHCQP